MYIWDVVINVDVQPCAYGRQSLPFTYLQTFKSKYKCKKGNMSVSLPQLKLVEGAIR